MAHTDTSRTGTTAGSNGPSAAGKRVFLTGHRGFIGSVVHRLLPEALVPEGRSPSVDELAARLEGIDCVVHLAGGGGAKRCAEHPAKALEDNVVLTHRLAEAARRAGVRRFVHASSIAVYGTTRSAPRPIPESRPAAPDDLYGSIKWTCEELLGELPHTVLRLANVYGYGTGAGLDRGGFLNRICGSARETRRITLTSATLGMDFVHVDDVARAIVLCARSDAAPPRLLNVGSGRAVALARCAELVRERLDVPVEIVVDERPGYGTRCLDVTRAGVTLGWRPEVELADGIAELLERTA